MTLYALQQHNICGYFITVISRHCLRLPSNSSPYLIYSQHFKFSLSTPYPNCTPRLSKGTADNYCYQLLSCRVAVLAGLFLACGLGYQITTMKASGLSPSPQSMKAMMAAPSLDCHASVSTGNLVHSFVTSLRLCVLIQLFLRIAPTMLISSLLRQMVHCKMHQ
jgi:hypothetical protein